MGDSVGMTQDGTKDITNIFLVKRLLDIQSAFLLIKYLFKY